MARKLVLLLAAAILLCLANFAAIADDQLENKILECTTRNCLKACWLFLVYLSARLCLLRRLHLPLSQVSRNPMML